MGATLQTIADALGVSRSTVSNAYSRPDQLSPELRSRILDTARRLGYAGPNPNARSLRSGKVGAIGVLLTANLSLAFSDPCTVAFLRGLAAAAERRETSLLLIPLPKDPEAAQRVVRGAVVDAFCVYFVPDWCGVLEVISSRGLPVVGGEDPELIGPDQFHVGIDERAAAREVGTHIANLGHRRVAILGHWLVGNRTSGIIQVDAPEDLPYFVTRERILGYREALAAADVPWSDVLLVNVAGSHRAEGELAAGFALDRGDRATAIIATSDVLALGAIQALAARGLRAGRDVSVTGFDDIPEAAAVGLTTIRQSSEDRGRLAGEVLLDPPTDPDRRCRVLPTTLVVRATTGPAPGL
ncbi:MAG: LacI family DNA-binding transcriptional regulator [Dactylosporangium sp.]|nr:LacI family DNA-binding transcriptional regulator [Dactylosporangium sp.]NNJ59388.1 LacI family DNA-binding transcriptional regulator [Dactylosporangium sp.]